MLYHYGNKFVHKTYSIFNAQFIKKSEIPKIKRSIVLSKNECQVVKKCNNHLIVDYTSSQSLNSKTLVLIISQHYN